MGGEVGGEIASTLASEAIAGAMTTCWSRFLVDPPRTVPTAEERLARGMKSSIDVAASRIKSFTRAHPRYKRMGTTATLAAIGFGSMLIAQVGDSRAYVLREGRLAQLTRDQTMAEWLRAQSPTGHPASEIYGSNVILQAVGASATLDIVLTRHELCVGDVVLLCSDGLSGPVDDGAIERILEGAANDPAKTTDELVCAANENGGPDNVSCVVFRVG
jgi:protein phosphatase